MLRNILNMVLIFIFLITVCCFAEEIQHCSVETETPTVCKILNVTYDPNTIGKPWPLEVQTIIRVLDIVNLDWKENTITFFIQMMTMWNDTRLTISNIGSGAYVLKFKIVLKSRKNAIPQ